MSEVYDLLIDVIEFSSFTGKKKEGSCRLRGFKKRK